MQANRKQIETALKGYKERNPGSTYSYSEEGFVFRLMDAGESIDKAIQIWMEDAEGKHVKDAGLLKCSNPEWGMVFSEYLKDIPSEEPAKQQSQSLVTNEQKKQISEIKEKKKAEDVIKDWRKNQDRSYTAEGGKEVPNAFAASEEANRQKICTETDSGRSETLCWGKARAIDKKTGQYREAKVNFDWRTFRQRTAWEIAKNLEKKLKGGVVLGIDEQTLLPILDGSKKFKELPLPLYVHMQILNRWTFADRDAESKAERRAILKLANREWRDDEEVEFEKEEERAVQEMSA